MVNVSKKAGTNKIEITSTAFIVDPWGESPSLFKKKSVHNRFYVVCDEKNGFVNVIYKPFVNFW